MTSCYAITLTRYDRKKCERRQSAPHNLQAENFHDAHRVASHMVTALNDANPDAEFAIAAITATGLGGENCYNGWMTREEWSASLAGK